MKQFYWIVRLLLLTGLWLRPCLVVAGDDVRFRTVSLDEVKLNRTATRLDPSELSRFPGAHTGFRWNDGDDRTDKFRPQGITGISQDDRQFIVVSWYGRKEVDYADRGVRLSFADVTDMSRVRYRHVLLVDPGYRTFTDMHGGGIAYRSGSIYVADSREGAKKLRVFPLAKLKKVPEEHRSRFHGYAYILQQDGVVELPVIPSFLSYDPTREQFLTGTFRRCQGKHTARESCREHGDARLAWFRLDDVGPDSPAFGQFFCHMQGAGSFRDEVTGRDILWITSSWGRRNPSLLHIMNTDIDAGLKTGDADIDHYRKVIYPPGLEDIHVASTSENVWFLTEFGPHEGKAANHRVVFAVKRREIMPTR